MTNETLHHQMHARGKQRVKEAITCLKLNKHDPKTGLLLDLGCGPGYLHEYFLKWGSKLLA
jgi:hypothetical protein